MGLEIGQILNHFKNTKHLRGSSYQARCPCHKDDKASLTITAEGDKILMHCHAGCKTEDILSAVGLKMSDLCAERLPQKKTWQEKLNVEAVYDYGEYVKLRQRGKVISYGRIIGNRFVSGLAEGTEKTLYRLDKMRETVKNGYPIFYVEGEKDADNLHKIGLTAVTAGGCGDWKADFACHFKGARVIILPDNDEPGAELAKRVERDLKDIAYSIKTVTISDRDKGDVSDYLADGGTRDSLLSLVKDAAVQYAAWVKTDKNGKPCGINADELAHTIAKSLDYIIINKAGLDIAEFHIFKDGVYKKCSKNEAKGYIKQYIPLGQATDNILNNVYNLLLCSPEKTCSFAQVNTNERYINVKNGIIDLKERALIKHSRELLSTVQLNADYDPKAGCPQWISYINSLCSDDSAAVDNEKVRLLQEWTGLLISNVDVSRTKKCLVLTSPLGNTGKSVYLNVINHLVGIDNTAAIPIQNMSDRFALGDLCGKRLDLVGDQRADDIEDSSVFKQLTGGDSVRIEFKGKQSFNWKFCGGIVMACNTLPAFKDDKGGHIFERFNIIPCENVIPPEKRDGALSHKLYAEADGILNWALEGLYRLRDNGFKFSRCKADKGIIEEYRSRLDPLYGFVNEFYEITSEAADRVKKTDFEDDYTRWCNENDFTPLNKRNIKDRAAKSGIALVKVQGIFCYKGLKPKVEFITEQENAPEPNVFKQQKLF